MVLGKDNKTAVEGNKRVNGGGYGWANGGWMPRGLGGNGSGQDVENAVRWMDGH
jgi:hypothetical protein